MMWRSVETSATLQYLIMWCVCAQVLNRNSVKPTHLGGGGGSAGKVPICVEIRLLRVMEITLENGLQWAVLVWGSAPLVQKSFKGRKINEDSQAGYQYDYVCSKQSVWWLASLFQYCWFVGLGKTGQEKAARRE